MIYFQTTSNSIGRAFTCLEIQNQKGLCDPQSNEKKTNQLRRDMDPHYTEEQIRELNLDYCSGSWGSPQWLRAVPSPLETKVPFMSTSLNKVYSNSFSVQRKFQVSRTARCDSEWFMFKVSQAASPLHSVLVLRQRSFSFHFH